MNLQAAPKLLNDAYTLFDSLNLSVTSLVVMGLLLTVVLLFVLRQAASWFFKVDDIKRDIRDVRQLVVDMEGEIRLLQGLLSQNVRVATELSEMPVPAPAAAAPKTKAPEITPAPSINFPIQH